MSQSLASPLREYGNNLSLISSPGTWYYLYKSHVVPKFNKCICGILTCSRLNWPIDCNIWNIIGFSSKLFERFEVSQCWNWNPRVDLLQALSMIFCLHCWFQANSECLPNNVTSIMCRGLISFFPVSLVGFFYQWIKR